MAEAPRIPKTAIERNDWQRVIFILEKASLESVKVGKKFELLNTDDHQHILKRNKRDPTAPRPDILHQCLLTLLDSPLNKAGKMQIFVHTDDNVLVEVNPQTRIPRTFKRFAALMVQLLHKLSIRSANGPEKLLKVVKNPVTSHLPTNARIIELSTEGRLVDMVEFAASLAAPSAAGGSDDDGAVRAKAKNEPVVIICGAHSHGQLGLTYHHESICVSQYALSAACALGRVTNGFEKTWGIV